MRYDGESPVWIKSDTPIIHSHDTHIGVLSWCLEKYDVSLGLNVVLT